MLLDWESWKKGSECSACMGEQSGIGDVGEGREISRGGRVTRGVWVGGEEGRQMRGR